MVCEERKHTDPSFSNVMLPPEDLELPSMRSHEMLNQLINLLKICISPSQHHILSLGECTSSGLWLVALGWETIIQILRR